MSNTYRIVVGVDGSDGGRRALRWAVHEAQARHGTVQAIMAWTWDGLGAPPEGFVHPDDERRAAQRRLADQLAAVHVQEGLVLADEVVEGLPAAVLTAAARDADLLVLGGHGHGRVHHAVLGSVSEECIRKATCPVVIVPVPHPADAAATELATLG